MTAVEWLDNEIENISVQVFDGFLTFVEFMEEREKLCKQAKEMEKQQIIEAVDYGKNHSYDYSEDNEVDYYSAKDYYNETFKK